MHCNIAQYIAFAAVRKDAGLAAQFGPAYSIKSPARFGLNAQNIRFEQPERAVPGSLAITDRGEFGHAVGRHDRRDGMARRNW